MVCGVYSAGTPANAEMSLRRRILGSRQNLLRFSGLAAVALAFAAFAPSAVAQNVRVFTCQGVGGGPPEPLGDREGHSISVDQGSCRVEGAYAGGVPTDEGIWEWDGPKAVELCGSGIVRKPGSTWRGRKPREIWR
jgi:hypothetical protein